MCIHGNDSAHPFELILYLCRWKNYRIQRRQRMRQLVSKATQTDPIKVDGFTSMENTNSNDALDKNWKRTINERLDRHKELINDLIDT